MNARWVSLAGALLLTGGMAFALGHLATADRWIAGWIPFVAAGGALAPGGVVMARCRRCPPAR